VEDVPNNILEQEYTDLPDIDTFENDDSWQDCYDNVKE